MPLDERRDVKLNAVPCEPLNSAGRNVIAVIGIDRYHHWQRLANAVHDATGTSALFRRLGFEEIVSPLLDETATGKAIQALVTDDLMALGPDDSLVLFFAGHGGTRRHHVQDKVIKAGYLIPVDAQASPERTATWIDLEAWLRAVSLLPAKHILVVLDACHSGIALDPIMKWRDVGSWHDVPLSTLNTRRSRRIITSALDDEVALDSGPAYGHSLFTGCLFEGLTHGVRKDGDMITTGSELGLYVQRRVKTYPSSRQTPDFGTFALDDRGEMIIPLAVEPRGSRPGEESAELPIATPREVPNPRPSMPPRAVPDPVDAVRLHARAAMPPAGSTRPLHAMLTLRVVLQVMAALALLVIAGYTGWRIKREPGPVEPTSERRVSSTSPVNPSPLPVTRHKLVVGVNNYGGTYPAVVANDGLTAGRESQFAALGLDVEVRLLIKPDERLAAFEHGDVDVVLLSLDFLANQAPVFRDKGVDLQAFLMADWSRGNLGIVATPRLTSIEDLKDARVATTKNTPSHYLLLTLLEKSNLGPDQIDKLKPEFVPNTEAVGDKFRRGAVDAAVIWEPYLSKAIAGGKGHVLVSTATASHLVPDVLIARASFLKEHEAEMITFARTWFEGVERMKREPQSSARIIAGALGQTVDKTLDIMNKVKLTTVADNREFFGLETLDPQYLKLFEDASRLWQKVGLIKTPVDGASTRWLKALEVLASEHRDEKVEEDYRFDRCSTATSAPLLTKTVSVYFAFNDDKLTAEARNQVDSAAEILSVFGNACVRVVGHADSIGSAASIKWFSERRAAAVVDYLVSRGFQRERFQPLGAGSDTKGDNATEVGRSRNRRTDFEIHINE
jgi:ABC-type nitrate/sulfonate/bicarbonate transport system substrate-binding protein